MCKVSDENVTVDYKRQQNNIGLGSILLNFLSLFTSVATPSIGQTKPSSATWLALK
jgi:hypothetical protein